MAPVSGNVVNLEDDQRMALMKFRRNVRDVLKPEHNDQFLLRWLRARQWNAEAAEKMLRDSMAWRERWGVDTTLDTWEPPEVLQKYFPSGTSGFDKEGSPIIIVPFSGLDVWGLLHSISRNDCIRMVIKQLEAYMATAYEQSKKYGPNAYKVIAIMDMEGFNMKQYAWKPAGEMVFSLIQIYEANYPEILKTCYIINAPKVFSLAFSIVKKFMHEHTISKIKIYSADAKKWQAQLLEAIEPDQLPVHYGGTLTDESGDPRCTKLIALGGKVPKEYHVRNLSHKGGNYTRITVKKGEKHTIDFTSTKVGSLLRWEVGVDDNDIKFSVAKKSADGKESEEVYGPKKVTGSIETGILDADAPATYTITFDNTSSYLRSKKVFYDIVLTKPVTEIKGLTNPEEEELIVTNQENSVSAL